MSNIQLYDMRLLLSSQLQLVVDYHQSVDSYLTMKFMRPTPIAFFSNDSFLRLPKQLPTTRRNASSCLTGRIGVAARRAADRDADDRLDDQPVLQCAIAVADAEIDVPPAELRVDDRKG